MADLFKEKSKDWDAREMIQLLSSAIGTSIIKHVSLNPSSTKYSLNW
ncbi:MAG: hypothetical protein HQK84_06630 [Nitrospinae bacterium]|nr:hypothetical protein [Nitrospinota bacterium]